MSTSREIVKIPARLKGYVDEISELFQKHKIKGMGSLISRLKSDSLFRNEWNSVWKEIARGEGGKTSLSTAGIILGASLGGIGIAAMGTAIGLPLFAVLGLAGFIVGSKVDDVSRHMRSNRDRRG